MRLEPRTIVLDDGTSVSVEIALPDGFRPGADTVVILGHGAGADMNSAMLSAVHRGLAERGLAAVKFNFPYSERKRRIPDRMPVLEACFRRVVETVRADEALRPAKLVLGGKSMGGRVASHLAAAGMPCAGLVLLGYPLHPGGKPEQLRTAHLTSIRVPMLFFSGTRDELCDLSLLRPALAALTVPITLHVIEGADHSFRAPRPLGQMPFVVEDLCDASARWIELLGQDA